MVFGGSPGTKGHAFWVEGMEPICAGLIAGAALIGIGDILVKHSLLDPPSPADYGLEHVAFGNGVLLYLGVLLFVILAVGVYAAASMDDYSETMGALSGAGAVELGSATLTVSSATSTTFSGVVSTSSIPSRPGGSSSRRAAGWSRVHRNQPAGRGEEDGGVQLLRRPLVRSAGPLRAQLAGKALPFRVARPGEGEHAPPLVPRHLRVPVDDFLVRFLARPELKPVGATCACRSGAALSIRASRSRVSIIRSAKAAIGAPASVTGGCPSAAPTTSPPRCSRRSARRPIASTDCSRSSGTPAPCARSRKRAWPGWR